MTKHQNKGLRRIAKAWGFSCKGLQAAWKYEAAFRQEIMLCCVMVPIAFLVGENAIEKAVLIF